MRDLAVAALEHARLQYRHRVFGFVVMPEHVHLLISEPARATVAQAVGSSKIFSAKSAARAGFRLPGRPLWQARYYDRNLRDYDEFTEKMRYLHRNPVKRGLCQLPEEWKWSSFRHYATGEACGVEIESQWAARRREAERESRCGRYLNPRYAP
jgi:putative transposase